MDRQERMDILLVAFRAALAGAQADIWTALPCVVVDYDAAKMTATVQPTIQARVQDKEGAWSDVTLPVIPDVPVQFPGSGEFVLTFPLAAGDEGVAVFSSRCIDSFWQSGGVQPQAEQRMHNLSDAMFMPGPLSQAKKIENVSADTAQLRSKDGQTYVELAAGGIVNVKALGGFNVIGPSTMSEGLALGGELTGAEGATYAHNIQTTGDVIARKDGAQVGLATHTHTQGPDGHGDTEEPTAAPTGGT